MSLKLKLGGLVIIIVFSIVCLLNFRTEESIEAEDSIE